MERFLDMMMMSSTIKTISIREKGAEVADINRHMLESSNYSGFGKATVGTYQILDNALIVNIKKGERMPPMLKKATGPEDSTKPLEEQREHDPV